MNELRPLFYLPSFLFFLFSRHRATATGICIIASDCLSPLLSILPYVSWLRTRCGTRSARSSDPDSYANGGLQWRATERNWRLPLTGPHIHPPPLIPFFPVNVPCFSFSSSFVEIRWRFSSSRVFFFRRRFWESKKFLSNGFWYLCEKILRMGNVIWCGINKIYGDVSLYDELFEAII